MPLICMWAAFVLFLVLWNFAVLAQEVVGESARWVGSMDPIKEGTYFQPAEPEPFTVFDRNHYFGSVGKSLMTLFQVATQDRWTDHVRPIVKVYPASMLFFLFLFLITTYGMSSS